MISISSPMGSSKLVSAKDSSQASSTLTGRQIANTSRSFFLLFSDDLVVFNPCSTQADSEKFDVFTIEAPSGKICSNIQVHPYSAPYFGIHRISDNLGFLDKPI